MTKTFFDVTTRTSWKSGRADEEGDASIEEEDEEGAKAVSDGEDRGGEEKIASVSEAAAVPVADDDAGPGA